MVRFYVLEKHSRLGMAEYRESGTLLIERTSIRPNDNYIEDRALVAQLSCQQGYGVARAMYIFAGTN